MLVMSMNRTPPSPPHPGDAQTICNQRVGGSIPLAGSTIAFMPRAGHCFRVLPRIDADIRRSRIKRSEIGRGFAEAAMVSRG